MASNKLQIEKAIEKDNFSIIFNNIEAFFVSNYLKNISKIYNFKNKTVIPNFLDKRFENSKISYNRKQIVVYFKSSRDSKKL